MTYRLGVDFGTTFTAAAVVRPGGVPEPVSLGDRSASVPSVVYVGEDQAVLVGDPAERRALAEPGRVVRQFKRRIGDETPLLVGPGGRAPGAHGRGTRDERELTAHRLAALLVAQVVEQVAEREGAAPEGIAVTHPASWGPHKRTLLADALRAEGLTRVQLVTEPAAAALAYAHTGRLEPGAVVAVYDLGGGTFDAAVLRAEPDGSFTPLGRPVGLPDVGGIDIDDVLLARVLAGLPGAADTAGSTAGELTTEQDELAVAELTRLRRECVEAKEALSADTTATVPVLLGPLRTNVRVTRAELEALIGPAVDATLLALDATLDSADLAPADLTQVLLTGGSSRIPLIAQLLSARLAAHNAGRVRVDRDIDPKLAVAMGAALAAAGAGRPGAAPVAAPAAGGLTAAAAAAAGTVAGEAAAAGPVTVRDVAAAAAGSGSALPPPPPATRALPPARPPVEAASLADVEPPATEPASRWSRNARRAPALVGLVALFSVGLAGGATMLRDAADVDGTESAVTTTAPAGESEPEAPKDKERKRSERRDAQPDRAAARSGTSADAAPVGSAPASAAGAAARGSDDREAAVADERSAPVEGRPAKPAAPPAQPAAVPAVDAGDVDRSTGSRAPTVADPVAQPVKAPAPQAPTEGASSVEVTDEAPAAPERAAEDAAAAPAAPEDSQADASDAGSTESGSVERTKTGPPAGTTPTAAPRDQGPAAANPEEVASGPATVESERIDRARPPVG